LRLHLPFYCAVCGHIVWPWSSYLAIYKPYTELGVKMHSGCYDGIIAVCTNPKEFMKEWDKIMRSVKNEKE